MRAMITGYWVHYDFLIASLFTGAAVTFRTLGKDLFIFDLFKICCKVAIKPTDMKLVFHKKYFSAKNF